MTLLVYIADRARNPYEWLTNQGFHYTAAAQNYWEPSPAPLLAPGFVPWFLAMYFGAIFLVIAGWHWRAATWTVWVCTLYVTLADTAAAFTINLLYVFAFLVLALAPKAITGVDGKLMHSAWPVRVLQVTLLVQYSTAGWCKAIYGDWLTNPDVLWSQVQGIYRTDLAAWMLIVLPKPTWTGMQWGALLFELGAPVWLGWKRLRPIGFIWGVGFQLVIALTMYKLTFFSSQLVVFYTLFFATLRLSDKGSPLHNVLQ